MAFFEMALANNFHDIRKSFMIKMDKFLIVFDKNNFSIVNKLQRKIVQKTKIIFLDSRKKSTVTVCLHTTVIKYFIHDIKLKIDCSNNQFGAKFRRSSSRNFQNQILNLKPRSSLFGIIFLNFSFQHVTKVYREDRNLSRCPLLYQVDFSAEINIFGGP